MKQDEKFIAQHLGKENPFRVPDGYFDGLSAEIMNRLPEREPRTVKMKPRMSVRMRPYLYAAVLAGIAVFTASIYFNRTTQTPNQMALSGEQTIQQHNVDYDQAADYLMLDNEEIYAYVAGY